MNNMAVLPIGMGSLVPIHQISSISSSESTNAKHIIAMAKEQGTLINASRGKQIRSAIMTNSPYVILSALTPETLITRLKQRRS